MLTKIICALALTACGLAHAQNYTKISGQDIDYYVEWNQLGDFGISGNTISLSGTNGALSMFVVPHAGYNLFSAPTASLSGSAATGGSINPDDPLRYTILNFGIALSVSSAKFAGNEFAGTTTYAASGGYVDRYIIDSGFYVPQYDEFGDPDGNYDYVDYPSTVQVSLNSNDYVQNSNPGYFSDAMRVYFYGTFYAEGRSSTLDGMTLSFGTIPVALPVPEMETHAMFLAGLAILAIARRRRDRGTAVAAIPA